VGRAILTAPVRRWRRFRYRRLLRRMAGPRLLRAFAEAYPQARFVEIGSNDGSKYDHLREHIVSGAWRGIMVEPVPYVFERLRANYGHLERVALENVAVADRDGSLPFYHVAEASEEERAQLPDWYDTIGSFHREAVASHASKIPGLEERIVTTEVPTVTFRTLLERNGYDQVDLVLIDTEGYDAEILATIDFDVHRPRLVIYEHFHLPAAERRATRARLEAHGYETMEEGFDTFCLDTRADDALTRAWRGLRPAVPGVSAEDERASA